MNGREKERSLLCKTKLSQSSRHFVCVHRSESDDHSSSRHPVGLEGGVGRGMSLSLKVTAAPSCCHSNRNPSVLLPSFFFNFYPWVFPGHFYSNNFYHVFLLCVWLWLVHYRSRRTSREHWLSGWPMRPSCSISSNRTETWVALRWTPRTSSPIWSRWPSSQFVFVDVGVDNKLWTKI